MSALGQKQTLRGLDPMSALPPKADIAKHYWDVCFVPKADIGPPIGSHPPSASSKLLCLGPAVTGSVEVRRVQTRFRARSARAAGTTRELHPFAPRAPI